MSLEETQGVSFPEEHLQDLQEWLHAYDGPEDAQ